MNIVLAAAPPFFKNGYLVSCEETSEGVVIDPGDEVDDLIGAADREQIRVTAILLTHAHLDHITGVGRAKRALGVDVWLHEADRFLYEGLVEQGLMFGLELRPQPPVDRTYAPDSGIGFGHYVVDVVHTPGHSPGGVCLAIGRVGTTDRELFVGDTLFEGSIGRTDLPGGDYDTLIASIRTVLFSYPDQAIVHPGHGPATTIGQERRANPFLAGLKP